ncbi:MAG: hypothetical protein V3571_08550, partial [Pseudodesulfovibrio sp.]
LPPGLLCTSPQTASAAIPVAKIKVAKGVGEDGVDHGTCLHPVRISVNHKNERKIREMPYIYIILATDGHFLAISVG